MRARSTAAVTAAMVMLGLAGTAADARDRQIARGGLRSAPAQTLTTAQNAPRWGGHTDGRWWAGSRAPGGWAAYQRPLRGSALPAYWAVPQWQVRDWSAFDLPAPPAGHHWTRYYDDAVLVDGRGIVHDTIGGVDWDQLDPPGADYAYRGDWAGDVGVSQASVVPNRAAPGTSYPLPQRAPDTLSVASVAAPSAATVVPSRAAPGAPYPMPGRDRGAVTTASAAAPSAATVVATPATPIPAAPIPAAPIPAAPLPAARSAAVGTPGAGYPVPPAGAWIDPAPVDAPYPPAVATRAPAPVAATAYPPAVATRAAPYREPALGAPGPIVTASNGARVETTTREVAPGYYSNGYYYPPQTIVTVTVHPQPVGTASPR